MAGPTGIEPAAYGLRVRRSSLTELRTRNVSLLKNGLLSNIELAVLLFKLDAVNTNNGVRLMLFMVQNYGKHSRRSAHS